jgi:hypothetical protein
MSDCGGCKGEGAHKRWCPWIVGAAASRLGRQAEQAEALGDSVGPNCMGASNALYAAASQLRAEAGRRASIYKARGQVMKP